MDYKIGQTLKDRRRDPTSTFTVLRVYVRTYENGDAADRVKGVLVTGDNGCGTHLRDLDSRSLKKMFPYILFSPPEPKDEEDK